MSEPDAVASNKSSSKKDGSKPEGDKQNNSNKDDTNKETSKGTSKTENKGEKNEKKGEKSEKKGEKSEKKGEKSEKKGDKSKKKGKRKSFRDSHGGGKNRVHTDVLGETAMNNALYICHSVQDLLFWRGYLWAQVGKKPKKKGKK